MNDKFFKRYRVGTGKDDKTPVGTFVISSKEVEPVWWPQGREIPYGDKENILGTRWMALQPTGETPKVKGYGIHGTWDDASVGKSLSAGCIRLANKDVEEIFVLVSLGTPVIITE
jgi:lipoprotein-anchoring transpeptidase ErfK/SrfK